MALVADPELVSAAARRRPRLSPDGGRRGCWMTTPLWLWETFGGAGPWWGSRHLKFPGGRPGPVKTENRPSVPLRACQGIVGARCSCVNMAGNERTRKGGWREFGTREIRDLWVPRWPFALSHRFRRHEMVEARP